MRRDKFAGGNQVVKFSDEKSGSTLFPYSDRVVANNTVWKAKKEPLGMLMVKFHFKAPEFSSGWEVCFRINETKEEFRWILQEQDILDNYDPVFRIIL